MSGLRGRRSRRDRMVDESGMATVEFAVALPAVVVVLTLVLAVSQLLLTHHRAWQAASVAARVAARGESDSQIRQAVAAAGLPATVTVTRSQPWVTADVSATVPAPLGWALPAVDARAVAAAEIADDAVGARAGPDSGGSDGDGP